LRESRPGVVVTIGGGATALALQTVPNIPVVFCMVPNARDRSFMDKGANNAARVVGVTTDISPQLQVDQIRRLSPKVTRVGLFHGQRSRKTAEAIRAEGEKAGLNVVLIPAVAEKFADALRALDQRSCDAALMIADAEVYNSPNVQAVLLWGLRGRKPVWGFSPNLVKAGAFAGLYADNAAVVNQTAGLVMKVLRGDGPPERGLRYPETTRGGVNERTAEMLGISLASDLYTSVAVRFQKQ
jgi:putative ABC transport system substrate-binding protein